MMMGLCARSSEFDGERDLGALMVARKVPKPGRSTGSPSTCAGCALAASPRPNGRPGMTVGSRPARMR